jgi:large subunit ribosomal protein L30
MNSLTYVSRCTNTSFRPYYFQLVRRSITTKPPSSSQNDPSLSTPNTHYKITLRRSAISLGAKIKGTLASLGIHRRNQTVYYPHSPEVAGKILKVKELVEVENVPTELVRTKQEQRKERQPPRGYEVHWVREGECLRWVSSFFPAHVYVHLLSARCLLRILFV